MEKITFIPKASSEPLPKLEAFLRPLASVFRRSTSTQSMERYVTGLLTDLEHKTCETIAAAVGGTSTERLQHLLTDAAWEATALDEQRVRSARPEGYSSWMTPACRRKGSVRRGWPCSIRARWARWATAK